LRLSAGGVAALIGGALLLAACGGPVTEGGVTPTDTSSGLAPAVSPTASCGSGADSTVTSAGTPDSFSAYAGASFTTTADGLKYADVVPGTGAAVVSGQCITVQYTGWLADGTKFDSSLDRVGGFQLLAGTAGQVIKGWQEGIPGMKVGGKRRLVIPPALGYGAAGSPPTIPANSTLTFDIEVLRIH
jgi:FKBP-type peptidyl-prolyl cis-trans isomerase